MLHQKYKSKTLNLIARKDWHPFPTINDRPEWESLPASVRKTYVNYGEGILEQEWPILLAQRYLDFSRDGNRSRYQGSYFTRRSMLGGLVIAECLENQGRFLDEIGNGIWLICEESSWSVPAHVWGQRAGSGLPDTTDPTVDLCSGETSALLAWTDYLLGDKLDEISPLIRPRLQREIDTRILTPCLERDDIWWMGFSQDRVNNWNPWVNSNWLTSNLLIEKDDTRRRQAVLKSLKSLDRFIDPYPTDGGCDEGPVYWGRAGAAMLDCLELLYSATNKQIDVYSEPLIQDIGRFIVRVQIDGNYFVNFADAPAIVIPPAGVVFRYGQRIADDDMMALGAWLAEEQDLLAQPDIPKEGRLNSLGRLLPTLFMLDELTAMIPQMPLPRDVWLDQIEVMVARDKGGSSMGFFVAAKGGHNAESHNHNDVGNVIVYIDGRPVLVDAGVETYTRKTFSEQRYTIWTMQSAYHNLPTINGAIQAPGPEFASLQASYEADDKAARLKLDIAKAYPPEANLKQWQRTITLRRGREVQINE